MYGFSFIPQNRKIPNTVQFQPPGFPSSIQVQFPDSILPVCAKCKKNYKTKQYCRGKECHQDLPWCDTFVCITLDPSCVSAEGKLAAGPFTTRPLPMQLFCYQTDTNRKSPICARCKQKSYTRTYCRNVKCHKQLPWSTVFVQLIAADSSGVVNVNYDRSEGRDRIVNTKRIRASTSNDNGEGQGMDPAAGIIHDKNLKDDGDTDDVTNNATTNIDQSFNHVDLEKISEKRFMLATISSKAITLEWVDIDPNFSVSMVPFVGSMDNMALQEDGTGMGWTVDYVSTGFQPQLAYPIPSVYASTSWASGMPSRPMFPPHAAAERLVTPTFPPNHDLGTFPGQYLPHTLPGSTSVYDTSNRRLLHVADDGEVKDWSVSSYSVNGNRFASHQHQPQASDALHYGANEASFPDEYNNVNMFHRPWTSGISSYALQGRPFNRDAEGIQASRQSMTNTSSEPSTKRNANQLRSSQSTTEKEYRYQSNPE